MAFIKVTHFLWHIYVFYLSRPGFVALSIFSMWNSFFAYYKYFFIYYQHTQNNIWTQPYISTQQPLTIQFTSTAFHPIRIPIVYYLRYFIALISNEYLRTPHPLNCNQAVTFSPRLTSLRGDAAPCLLPSKLETLLGKIALLSVKCVILVAFNFIPCWNCSVLVEC